MKALRKLQDWTIDKIVAVGLVVMGLISVIGYIIFVFHTGQATGSEIPMAVVSGLTGYLGRGTHKEFKEGQ